MALLKVFQWEINKIIYFSTVLKYNFVPVTFQIKVFNINRTRQIRILQTPSLFERPCDPVSCFICVVVLSLYDYVISVK